MKYTLLNNLFKNKIIVDDAVVIKKKLYYQNVVYLRNYKKITKHIFY